MSYSSDSFPNKVGNSWHYLVSDTAISLGVPQTTEIIQYNLDVSIKGITHLPTGEEVTIWQYKYPDHTDTSLVYQHEDSLKYMYKAGTNVNMFYIVPLKTNTEWSLFPGYGCGIFGKVLDTTSLQVNSFHFNEVMPVSIYGNCPDVGFNVLEWYVRGVGLVKRTNNNAGSFIINHHFTGWSLQSYHLL